MLESKVIASYAPPRYVIERRPHGDNEWVQVATNDREFDAKVAAEKYATKHDVYTRVIDRGE